MKTPSPFDPWSFTFALLWHGPDSDVVRRIDDGRIARGLPSVLA